MTSFSETLKSLRQQHGLSQQQLANKLFVDRSSIAHWESGRRIPDAVIISRLARYFGVDSSTLLAEASTNDTPPNVITVDDEDILLAGAMPVLSGVMPGASITGFTKPSEAIRFAHDNRVDIAFLDIERGKVNGLDMCRELLDIYPLTNVVFLTGYSDYALEAWDTGACGFIVKPLHPEDVVAQLGRLRTPVNTGSPS